MRARRLLSCCSTVLAVFAALIGVVAPATPAAAATSTVTVGNGDLSPNGPWALEPSSNTGTYSFVTGPAPTPGGSGSLALGIASGQHEWLNNYDYGACNTGPSCNNPGNMTPITNIDALSYSTYRASGTTVPTMNIEVYSTGVGGYTTFVFVPSAGAVTSSTWQTWDAYNTVNGTWYSTSNLGVAPFNCNFQAAGCNATWSQIKTAYPNAKIVFGLGPNVGTGGTFSGNVDNFTVGVSGNTKVFDFEADCTTDCYVATTGNDNNTGNANDPLATITAAIAKVTTNGTVHVLAGTYTENVNVTKAVTIDGAGANTTTVRPATSAPNPCAGSSLCGGSASNVFLVSANNVTISNLTVDGDNPSLTSGIVRNTVDVDARNGIITNNIAGSFTGLVVHHATVKNVYLRGIYGSGGTVDFHNDTVDNVAGDGGSIGLFTFGGSGTMHDNVVSRANDAIAANHSAGTTFFNNTVTQSGSGIHTDNAGDGGLGNDVIHDNNVSACAVDGYGVWAFVPYRNVTINNNTISGCTVPLSAFGGQGGSITFTANSATADGTANSAALYVTNDQLGFGDGPVSVTATQNVLTGAAVGAQVDEVGTSTSTASLVDNSFAGNTDGVINNAAANVPATCSWWGSSSGPSGNGPGSGTSVSANVTFSPWLTSSNLNGPCTSPKLYVGDASVVMNDTGTVSLKFPITLDGPATQSVQLHYATQDDTASAPTDYTAKSGNLTFSPGQLQKSVLVTVKKGTTSGTVAMKLNLTNVTGAVPTRTTGTGTIHRRGSSAAGVGVGSVAGEEGSTGKQKTRTVTFAVALNKIVPNNVTVTYAATSGTAIGNNDFNAKSGTLIFQPGQRVKYVTVALRNDVTPEPDETFNFTLTGVSGTTTLAGLGAATGTVLNDD